MSSQTALKPFTLTVIAIMIVGTVGMIAICSDDSEAALGTFTGGKNHSTTENPYTGIDLEVAESRNGNALILAVGSHVHITNSTDMVMTIEGDVGLDVENGEIDGTVTKEGRGIVWVDKTVWVAFDAYEYPGLEIDDYVPEKTSDSNDESEEGSDDTYLIGAVVCGILAVVCLAIGFRTDWYWFVGTVVFAIVAVFCGLFYGGVL